MTASAENPEQFASAGSRERLLSELPEHIRSQPVMKKLRFVDFLALVSVKGTAYADWLSLGNWVEMPPVFAKDWNLDRWVSHWAGEVWQAFERAPHTPDHVRLLQEQLRPHSGPLACCRCRSAWAGGGRTSVARRPCACTPAPTTRRT